MTNKDSELDNEYSQIKFNMKNTEEEKMLTSNSSYTPRPFLVVSLAILLVVIGVISFFYSGGLKTLQNSWLGKYIPSFTLEVIPEKSFFPADGTTQIYVDSVVKNKNEQLLSDEEINIKLIQGEIDITNVPSPPTGISRRILLRAPLQPQNIVLDISFKNIHKNLEIEAFNPTPPLMPVLKTPVDKAFFSTATPELSGEAEPEMQIEIYIDDRFNTLAEVNKEGIFNTSLERAIGQGIHKLTIVAINKYGIRSNVTTPIYIEIKTPEPEIDIANIRIKPNPAIASQPFYIFIPASSNTESVLINLDGQIHKLKDTYGSSIFSGVIVAPSTPGLYRISATIITDGGDSVLAENIYALQVN